MTLTRFPTKSTDTAEHHQINLYSLKDITSDSFGAIFESRSDDAAKRAIGQHIQLEPTTLFAMYPADYQLHRIGTFDRVTGKFSGKPEYLCPASALKPLSNS